MGNIRCRQPVRKISLAHRRRDRLDAAERSLAAASAALERAERRGDAAARTAAMRKVLWATFAREEARGAAWLRDERREHPGWKWRTQLALNFPTRRIAPQPLPTAPELDLAGARARLAQLERSALWGWTRPQDRWAIERLASHPNFGLREATAIGRILDVATHTRSPPLWLSGCPLKALQAVIRDRRSGLWRIFEIDLADALATPTRGSA
jgi:hypothetical protein